MPQSRFDWHERIKSHKRREYRAVKIAVERLSSMR